ncbi:hypothetical protein AMTRI_Chr09g16130 [Amborella trichopoda]
MAYATATPKQLEDLEGPKSRADANYLFVHNMNSEKAQKDENAIIVTRFTELGSKLISEFVSESPIQYVTNIVLLGKRNLQSIDDFEECSKSYSNECYKLRLHNNATCNAYYLASLPSNIPELVLETLSMKNIAVQNLVMADVLCYKDDIETYIKAASKVCNTIEGTKKYNIPKFKKSHKRKNFKPYKFYTRNKRIKPRAKRPCYTC